MPSLKPKPKLSNYHLNIFIIIFALIGGVVLLITHAASNPNLPGDLNNDNTVNAQDLSLLLSNYGTTNSAGDVNSDGLVNAIDLSILLSHYGSSYTSTVTLGTSLPARMPESSGAGHIYVSPSGSDSNSGTISSPVKSLDKAVSLAGNGYFVEVRGNAGVFSASYQNVTTRCSFSNSNPVTVRTYPGDAEAQFSSTTTTLNNVYFGGCSGIRVRHLIFSSATAASGIKVDSCVHFELDNITVGPNGQSISRGANAIMVTSSVGSPAIMTTDLQIWNSTVFDWYRNQGDTTGNHGLYLATSEQTVVANNIFYNTVSGGGYGIQLGAATSDSFIVNNTIDHVSLITSNPTGSGIVVWGSTTEGVPSHNDLIVNNIFSNNIAYGVVASGSTPGPLSVVRNNLSYANAKGDYQPNYGSNVLFTVQSPGYSGDPLYLNYSGKDFHLKSGSAAFGKADPAYTPPYDHDGNARSSTPNLGAY